MVDCNIDGGGFFVADSRTPAVISEGLRTGTCIEPRGVDEGDLRRALGGYCSDMYACSSQYSLSRTSSRYAESPYTLSPTSLRSMRLSYMFDVSSSSGASSNLPLSLTTTELLIDCKPEGRLGKDAIEILPEAVEPRSVEDSESNA